MEILQTIWTALTTENENFIAVMSVPLTILEVTLTMLLFTTILNINATNELKISYVLIFTISSILSSYLIPNPYNTFINVLICPILVILLFKVSLFKAILAELIPYTIFVLTGSIVLNIYLLLFDVSTDTMVKVPIYKLMLFFSNYLFVYIVYYFFKHFKINITLLDNIKAKSNNILLVNFFFGLLAVCVQAYIASIYSEVLPLGVIFINISTLLFYFIFSLYSLVRTNKLEIAERDLEQSKQYINTLTILHDSIRCFKHDFGNMVTTIGRLCAVK